MRVTLSSVQPGPRSGTLDGLGAVLTVNGTIGGTQLVGQIGDDAPLTNHRRIYPRPIR
ncbi:MAG: hypothetical protein RML32_12165 [Gammaproteobacteria bacterium]|nr:hypothetical protein [Gammaproteobacteria bacterium]